MKQHLCSSEITMRKIRVDIPAIMYSSWVCWSNNQLDYEDDFHKDNEKRTQELPWAIMYRLIKVLSNEPWDCVAQHGKCYGIELWCWLMIVTFPACLGWYVLCCCFRTGWFPSSPSMQLSIPLGTHQEANPLRQPGHWQLWAVVRLDVSAKPA